MWKEKLMRLGHWLSIWLFWPGVALICWGELTPHPPSPIDLLGWDKAEHFIAYFGLAAMAALALGIRRSLAWAVMGVIVLGGFLEILQGITGRDADVLDFVANTIGALTGASLGVFVPLWLRAGLRD